MSTAEEIKQTAHQLIDGLPDDTTWEMLLYALQVRHDIEAGLADIDAGRVYSTADVRKRLDIDRV